MKLRWRRLILAALVSEALPIVLLVLVVLLLGPGTVAEDEAFAASVGRWFGPVVGTVVTFLVGLRAARGVPQNRLLHGVVLGVLVAALDVSILAASGTAFQWLFVGSALLRVAAGSLAGFIAARNLAD